jgi:hypothetical protein
VSLIKWPLVNNAVRLQVVLVCELNVSVTEI